MLSKPGVGHHARFTTCHRGRRCLCCSPPAAAARPANTLGRVGTVEEIGALVVFLASDAAGYISSTNIVIDAGFTAVKAF